MAKNLENIFNECLERMFQGESIDSCLGSYPEEAAELEPLLRTAMGFSWRASSLQPRPEFKAQTRLRLQGAQTYATQPRQPQRHGFLAWQRGWAFALTAALIVLLSGTGTVAASSNALPDETLYPVKLATEQVKVAFTFSDAGKAELHSQLAEDRAMEIAAMAHKGKSEQVVVTTERLAKHLEKANSAIMKVAIPQAEAPQLMAIPKEATTSPQSGKGGAALDMAEVREVKQLKESVVAILENALEDTPEQAKQALHQAIKVSEKSYKKIQQAPDTEDKGKNKDNGNQEKPISVEPKQIQPSTNKEQNKPTSDEPEPNQPSANEAEDKPTSVKPKQNQPSTQNPKIILKTEPSSSNH